MRDAMMGLYLGQTGATPMPDGHPLQATVNQNSGRRMISDDSAWVSGKFAGGDPWGDDNWPEAVKRLEQAARRIKAEHGTTRIMVKGVGRSVAGGDISPGQMNCQMRSFDRMLALADVMRRLWAEEKIALFPYEGMPAATISGDQWVGPWNDATPKGNIEALDLCNRYFWGPCYDVVKLAGGLLFIDAITFPGDGAVPHKNFRKHWRAIYDYMRTKGFCVVGELHVPPEDREWRKFMNMPQVSEDGNFLQINPKQRSTNGSLDYVILKTPDDAMIDACVTARALATPIMMDHPNHWLEQYDIKAAQDARVRFKRIQEMCND